jgi:TM2 domain-containing membrane protein YozV
MQFCPACGFSFTQQPNQPYAQNQYGPQPYGPQPYQHKSAAIALILSVLIPGLGQFYVGKIKRGIAFIATFVILTVMSTALTMSIDYSDINAIKDLIGNPAYIIISLVSFGFWLFNLFDAYRQTKKYNEASVRNDLPRFLKEF